MSEQLDENLRRQPAQDRSTQRLGLILDTTATLIDELGLSGISISSIARESQMSGPAIYRYFDDIDAIVRALATRNLERFLATTAAMLSDESLGWEDAVAGSVDTYVDMYRNEPGFRTLRIGASTGPHVLSDTESSKSIVAGAIIAYYAPRYETWARPNMVWAIEAMIEIIDALVARAFEGEGEQFFISEAKRVGIQYLGDFLLNVPGTPPGE